MKVYTKTGDKGETALIGGQRVSKADLRLDAYGTVDELNSHLGSLITLIVQPEERAHLQLVQTCLFDIGSQLACENETLRAKMPNVDESMIGELEAQIDGWTKKLKPLKNFVLPGGSPAAASAHIARTVCRRAERLVVSLQIHGAHVDEIVVRYLNRLSDWLFVYARELNRQAGCVEPIWAPRNS